jgi:hypothetical protein
MMPSLMVPLENGENLIFCYEYRLPELEKTLRVRDIQPELETV